MTATRIEFHAVARALPSTYPVRQYGYRALSSHKHGLTVLLLQSGIGHDKARRSVQQLLADGSWDVIISTGFAGDLEMNSIGSVLIGHKVFLSQAAILHDSSTPPSFVCHPDWVNTAVRTSWMGQGPLRTGKFVSVDRVLINSGEKRQLHIETGAVGVDMESAAIGEVAQEHGVPFLIVRAISDGAHDDLPVDFNLFLQPSGWVSGIMQIITTPASWKGFVDLYRHSKQAALQLTQFFEGFFSGVSRVSPSPRSVDGK